jgi:hypothetical protein
MRNDPRARLLVCLRHRRHHGRSAGVWPRGACIVTIIRNLATAVLVLALIFGSALP